MKKITRKSMVRLVLAEALSAYEIDGVEGLLKVVDQELLDHAVKFPLLEFVAEEISEKISVQVHVELCDEIVNLQKEGGNVLLGILMHKYWKHHPEEAFDLTQKYINIGAIWYSSDLIGERVFGRALLLDPKSTFTFYRKVAKIGSQWVRRSLGSGGHFAIKRGLETAHVEQLFLLLLNMAQWSKIKVGTNEKEIRQGVGWAAKTTAKFHPKLIHKYTEEIAATTVPNWFRRKIEIGLERHRHVQGD